MTDQPDKPAPCEDGLQDKKCILLERHVTKREPGYQVRVIPPDLCSDQIIIPGCRVNDGDKDVGGYDQPGGPSLEKWGQPVARSASDPKETENQNKWDQEKSG